MKLERQREFILLASFSLLLLLMGWKYYSNVKPILVDATEGYKENRIVNLKRGFDETAFKTVIAKGDYFSDTDYENFVTASLKKKFSSSNEINLSELNNLGQLNRRSFQVNAFKMGQEGGKRGEERYRMGMIILGMDELTLERMEGDLQSLPSVCFVSDKPSDLSFTVKVIEKKKSSSKLPLIARLLKDQEIPRSNVLVRITEEYTSTQKDSILNSFLEKATKLDLLNVDLDTLVKEKSFYARTNEEGQCVFSNLERGKNYSIIPLNPGFEYGLIRGASDLSESRKFKFVEREHLLPLFDRFSYSRIKTDKVFTVRSPEVFKKNLLKSAALFLLGFWLFHLSLYFPRKKERSSEQIILPLLMLVIGVGIIILYAIQEPLRDNDYGTDTIKWLFSFLLFASVARLFFDTKRLQRLVSYNFFKNRIHSRRLIGSKLSNILAKESKGYFWVLISLLLLVLMYFFGSGPEGSGVKVNLGPIQISELVKLCVIIFFARFFANRHLFFREIADNRYVIWRYTLLLIIMFVTLIVIYVVLVGDQGPALVLCLTFLVFYSFAKKEFARMLLTALLFVLSLLVLGKIGADVNILALWSAAVLFILAAYSFIKKRDESSLLIVLLISSFIFLSLPILTGDDGFSFACRLAERNSMYENMWYNHLYGGDQVAQGVWALSSGGFTGQGLGKGFSNVMPAYHTDMIFESIGEELGILSLCLLLIAFVLLFYRCIIVARRTGHLFYYYLITGIAVATFIQLFIIVGGSLGVIPLTGISVPFLSKGNSSLLVNVFAFVVVLVLSCIKGHKAAVKDIHNQFDDLNNYLVLSFVGVVLLFSGYLFYYSFTAEKNMLRPVQVLSKQGEWIYSHNPRLSIVTNKMKAGNIYDRNGVLLATDDRDRFKDSKKDALELGASQVAFEKQENRRQRRYYPFSEELLYWLGDRNSGLVSSENIGYVADYRLASQLRGFESPLLVDELSPPSPYYREAPYLPKEKKSSRLVSYDYSAYAPYLKNQNKIKDFNEKEGRDIHLSIDMNLHKLIKEAINDYEKDKSGEFKISVVALKSATGEVLASVMSPSPCYEDVSKLAQFNKKYYNKLMTSYFGVNHHVADRDYGLFYRTNPGSTIKPLDAYAYLQRDTVGMKGTKNPIYRFSREESIGKHEKDYLADVNIDMRLALVKSSNNYFISLVEEKQLHPELFDLYHMLGINIAHIGGYYLERPPNYREAYYNEQWLERITRGYDHFRADRYQGTVSKYKGRDYSYIAWGQGPVEATPLQMARFMGAIANNGELYKNSFIHRTYDGNLAESELQINLQRKDTIIGFINYALLEQSRGVSERVGLKVAGKTGSPEKEKDVYYKTDNKIVKETKTDAWYIFYVKNSKYENSPIAFAVYIEGLKGSGYAVDLSKRLLKKLENNHYFIQKPKR